MMKVGEIMRCLYFVICMIILGACANPEPPLPPCDDKESCEKAIALLVDSKISEKNLSKIIEYTIKACDLGSSKSCILLGNLHQDSYESYFQKELAAKLAKRNIVLDYHKAKAFYEKAIGYGAFEAYIGLSSLYFRGIGVEQDDTQAISLLTKACDKKIAEGCQTLGDLYEFGSETIKKDYDKASKYYTKVCDLRGSCHQLYRLGQSYYHGIDTKQDYQKARELLLKPVIQI